MSSCLGRWRLTRGGLGTAPLVLRPPGGRKATSRPPGSVCLSACNFSSPSRPIRASPFPCSLCMRFCRAVSPTGNLRLPCPLQPGSCQMVRQRPWTHIPSLVPKFKGRTVHWVCLPGGGGPLEPLRGSGDAGYHFISHSTAAYFCSQV